MSILAPCLWGYAIKHTTNSSSALPDGFTSQTLTHVMPHRQSAQLLRSQAHLSSVMLQVLAVIFDILVSHRRMAKWHEEKIRQHVQDAAHLAEQREQLTQRLASHQQATSSSSSSKPRSGSPHRRPQPAPQSNSRGDSPMKAGPRKDGVIGSRHKSSKSDGDLAFHAMENGHAMERTRSHDVLVNTPAEVQPLPDA